MPVLIHHPVAAWRRRAQAAAVVLAVSRGDNVPVPVVGEVRRQDLLDAVRRHRVAPLAHVALRGSDPDLSAALRPDRDAALRFHVRATATLAELHHVLDGIDWLVVKGPALSELAHPVPGLRTYSDLDVLVPPERIGVAAHALWEAGWVSLDRPAALRMDPPPGEMHWAGPDGMVLDLHWTLINSPETRRSFRLSAHEMVERSREVRLGLATARTLDVEDTVVHTCLHAALTGAHRMLLLLDADRAARAVTDWDAVARRAREWGAGPAVALVLRRSRRLLGTPLPAGFDRPLGMSLPLRIVSAAVDRSHPVHRVRREASLPRVLARSARPDGASTLAELRRRGARGVHDRITASGPRPLRTPPTPEDVGAFVQCVERQAEVVR